MSDLTPDVTLTVPELRVDIVGPDRSSVERLRLDFLASAADYCDRAIAAVEAGDLDRAERMLGLAHLARAVARGVPAMTATRTLADLRRDLVAARAEHRAHEDALKTERARAEQRAIEAEGSAYPTLKNEGERTRFLTLALAEDTAFRLAVQDDEEARQAVEQIVAEIEIRLDARKERWLGALERLADAGVDTRAVLGGSG